VFVPVTFVILAISLFGHKTVGYQDLKLNNLAENKSLYIDHFREQPRSSIVREVEKKLSLPSILVIGDSMAGDFAKALATREVFVEILSLDGFCFEGLISNGSSCNYNLEDIISMSSSFDHVFISTDFVKERSIHANLRLSNKLSEFADVYLVNGFRFEHASDVSYRYATGQKNFSNAAVFKTLRKEVHAINKMLKNETNVKILDKYSYFCDDEKRECLLYSENGDPLRYDELHLTFEGLEYYGDRLLRSLCIINSDFCFTTHQ